MTTVNQKLQLCIKAKDEIKEAINAKASTLATDDIRTFADAINSIEGGGTTWVTDPVACNIASITDGTYRTLTFPFTVDEDDSDTWLGVLNAINGKAHSSGESKVVVNGEELTLTTDTPPNRLDNYYTTGYTFVNTAKTIYVFLAYNSYYGTCWCYSASDGFTIESIEIYTSKDLSIYTWSDGTDLRYNSTYKSPITINVEDNPSGKIINLGNNGGTLKYYLTDEGTVNFGDDTDTLYSTDIGSIGYYSLGTEANTILHIPANAAFAIISHPVGVSPTITDEDA